MLRLLDSPQRTFLFVLLASLSTIGGCSFLDDEQSSAHRAEVQTDKSLYAVGETAAVRITNTGQRTLFLETCADGKPRVTLMRAQGAVLSNATPPNFPADCSPSIFVMIEPNKTHEGEVVLRSVPSETFPTGERLSILVYFHSTGDPTTSVMGTGGIEAHSNLFTVEFP